MPQQADNNAKPPLPSPESLVSVAEARKIANLAKLNFSDQELAAMAHSMTDILTLMRQLDKVPSTNSAPLLNPLDETQILRDDIAKPCGQDREGLEAIAPDTADGYYQVPKVIAPR